MSRTRRRIKKTYVPWWAESPDDPRMTYYYNSDAFNPDNDPNPPKWFKTIQQKRFRRKMNMITHMENDPVIPADFKMPYYT